MPRREVFGHVYELVLAGQADDEHSYVGRTTQTIHQRVHGPRGHTSAESVRKDPWKREILPGRTGYRQLEVVYATGDGRAADERQLARAEAFWIDRLRPVRNVVRPVRPRATVTAVRRPVRRPLRPYVIVAFMAAFTWLAARLVVAMELPWAAAPWVVAPAAGAVLGWLTFWRLHAMVRKATRPRRRSR